MLYENTYTHVKVPYIGIPHLLSELNYVEEKLADMNKMISYRCEWCFAALAVSV